MERLMQYVWEHRLILPADMRSVDGERLEVIDTGLLNRDAGPDFFNAKVRVGNRTWAGNVEVHVRASDWHRHGHDGDRAYDSVILHVVRDSDCRIFRSNGEMIPQMVMTCASDFNSRYSALVDSASIPACVSGIASVPGLYLTDWLASLAFERLYAKADRVEEYYRTLGSWNAAVYATLARALGFGLNGDAFERVARATPLSVMLKHADSPAAVEGMLFGQAGMLGDDNPDRDSVYVQALRREYEFMRHKFGLRQPEGMIWKMARTRPQNFPHRRLAVLAAFVAGGFRIGAEIMRIGNENDARALFDVDLKGYWARRHTFGSESARSARALSDASVNTLIINVVVPVLYAYGTVCGYTDRIDLAVDLLQSLKPENNSVVAAFTAAGISCRDAFSSQALVELRRNYCDTRKCLYCRIGHRLLSQLARQE